MNAQPGRPLSLRLFAALAAVALAGCAGGGSQSGPQMLPANVGGAAGSSSVGNAVVRIFVPAGQPNPTGRAPSLPAPPVNQPVMNGPVPLPVAPSPGGPPAAPAPSAPPGSQILAISVNGPTTLNENLAVGPGASGCTPAAGGTSCQLMLALPAGTYTGSIGAQNASPTAIAFTVTPNGQNVFNLTTGGVPAQITLVSASSMSAQNGQGVIDLYGAGRHPLLVEALDANQNLIVGNGGATFSLSQSGGSLPVNVTQTVSSAPNLFYVTPGSAGSTTAFLRATVNYLGPNNPCVQANAACSGNLRVDVRQALAVANGGANDVTLYVNGQNAPLITVQNGITNPQALLFDSAGDLFVANQPGSVAQYAAPYNASPNLIANGVNHPQALAMDARGNLFVANGNGSNTVTLYAPPYGGAPAATISSGVDDPIGIALDSSAQLFVVNAANNTVTVYQPPYVSAPTVISKGLNAPNSLALDSHGNLFVANLNSTPNSVVEFSPPFTNQSSPVITITNGINEQGTIGLNGSANLFVPNQGASTVTEYVAPYVNPPTTIAGGQSQPVALAIDALGNLYVANYGNNTITEYAPPYANGSWSTLSTGVSLPLALALSPSTNTGAALLP
jgi:hypothetical protein